jgi:glycosyltransferase involved in cell wall biosynthesis
MITGDKKFGPGNARYELQKSAVGELGVVYWGRGSLWPKFPPGYFDVVTAQDPFWRGLFAWYLARRLGVRFNVQVHTDLATISFVKHVLAHIVLRHAHSIRVVSEKIGQQVKQLGITAPIVVLPVYVDVSAFSTVARRPHTAKNILWIGRFEEEKNPLGAIEILKSVGKEIPNAHLTMIGQGTFGPKLLQQAAHLPMTVPSGWQNPFLYLDTADVVLCTSWYESWGASIVEALAAGVPVVAPDVGVAREAGAIVAERSQLAKKTIDVLRSGARGELKLKLLSAPEWAARWRESLL